MTTGVPQDDAAARRTIATAIDSTIIVEAAAGTGKTTELVNRILSVIEHGRADIGQIVAVTFTEKAAGELKLRLRQRLEERRRVADPEVGRRLDDAVQHLEEAHVSTIHGFCADLLRERPVEARVDPLFRVLTEGQAQRLFGEAFNAWFEEHLEDPPEGVRRSLRRTGRTPRPGEVDDDGPLERLRRAGFELTQWRDFRTAWTRQPFDRTGAIDRLTALVHVLADLSASPSYVGDNLFVDTAPVRRLSADMRARLGEPDVDGLEAAFVDLRKNRDFTRARKGSGPGFSKGVTRIRVLDARGVLMEALEEFRVRADADLAALLHTELLDCLDRYAQLKVREGVLDFLDLLLRARDLIHDDAGVRRHFQARFSRIFVDEFQDTDPLQAELLLLLAAGDPEETNWERVVPVPGKLFLVGDPKQSIYRFRRADVGAYQRVCDRLVAAGATSVELRKSFRAVPNIQRAVNAAFAPLMKRDTEALQAGYMPLEPARADHPGQPSVVVLPVPQPYGARYITARQIEESLPDAVGAYIDWLVRQSGWTVTERRDPNTRVPLEARHICILFRRFVSFGADVTRPYVDALEARGVPHLLVGGRTFHDREETETLRAALMATEWPDDQLSVFATLRGSLFAIGDADLLEYHHLAKRFHPFRIPGALPDRLEPIREALSLMADLHRQRNRRPVADTIATLLDSTRAHVGFVLRPGGEQALANVLHVAELARQYELEGGMSFRGFVDTLQAEAAAGQAAEAPILEEGSDGVRLMTVHKAKGLEFPVVILGDITARLTPWEAGRYVDSERRLCALRIGGWSPYELHQHKDEELVREQKEGERVAYVAATRARDLLVVPAVGDEPFEEGWAAPLNGALYPDHPRSADTAAGCPSFKSKDTVLPGNRPGGDPATSGTVCPGLHVCGDGDAAYEAVWWSPESGVLDLGAQPSFGLRRDDLIVKEVALDVVAAGTRAYVEWRNGRDRAIAAARVPSITVRTATEWATNQIPNPNTQGPKPKVEIIALDVQRDRPQGPRFGTLVHAALATVALDADAVTLAQIVRMQARIVGATDMETDAAIDVVRAALVHPVFDRARVADREGRCLRETPVTITLDDMLIEGNVDFAFEDESGYQVIDFKTDRAEGDMLQRYERQVGLYARAIAQATGRPARAMLMKL